MLKELAKFINNQAKGESRCAKMVGSTAAINRFARFWEYSKDDLMVLASGRIHQYLQDNNPSKEELIAFKKGLAEISLFFRDCYLEKKKQEELPKDSKD